MEPEDTIAFNLPSPIMEIKSEILDTKNIALFVKREDLIHPWLSGNKYRKLKYNILKAKSNDKTTFVTFGGAFSNHIVATAGAGKLYGLKTLSIIRGEIDEDNPTLSFCREMGMQLIPVSRQAYRNKESSEEIKNIIQRFPDVYLVPEGGTNTLALQGVSEMLSEIYAQMQAIPIAIVLPCGTGGTAAGMLINPDLKSRVLAFSSLKSNHLYDEIINLANGKNQEFLTVINDYHFGGYGDWDNTLLDFISQFEIEHNIPLDHVYNGKAMYGLLDMIKNDYFNPGTSICYIHTGGLQGRAGLEYIKSKRKR
jgi:1-aminocyclopropane-1-carboxylate deaminase